MARGIPVVALIFLGGCSGISAYHSAPDHNLTVYTQARSTALFTRVRTALDIYSVRADCKLRYQGTLQLNRPAVALGVPVRQRSLLVFRFDRAAYLAGTSAEITDATLFTPEPSDRYTANVRYAHGIYDVHLRARRWGGRAPGWRVPFLPLADCRPLKR